MDSEVHRQLDKINKAERTLHVDRPIHRPANRPANRLVYHPIRRLTKQYGIYLVQLNRAYAAGSTAILAAASRMLAFPGVIA